MSDEAGNAGGDPFEIMKAAYSQVVDNWSAAMEQVVTTEEFAAASGRFLQQYAELTEAGRSATRATADSLHLVTKDDIARVATLVANVERKVDEVSDELHGLRGGLESIERRLAELAPATTTKKKSASKSGKSTKKAAPKKPAPRSTDDAEA